MITEQADEPQKISSAPAALGEKPEAELPQAVKDAFAGLDMSGVIVCWSRCWGCMCDSHYEEPTWHTWADSDDIDHAKDTGQQDPSTQRCGCWCAKGTENGQA